MPEGTQLWDKAPVRRFLLILITGCSFTPGQPGSPPEPDAATPNPACSDSDGDGVCDAVDTWPCGPEPTAPPSSLDMQLHGGTTDVALTHIAFDGGSPLLVVAPGAAITVHLDYAIQDTACPGDCRDQIELGYVAGARVGCVFDDAVPQLDGSEGHVDQTISAPMVGGIYDLRANVGQNLSCTYGGATGWWGQTPGTKQAIAKLCVH